MMTKKSNIATGWYFNSCAIKSVTAGST
jgi:hypothetical protein